MRKNDPHQTCPTINEKNIQSKLKQGSFQYLLKYGGHMLQIKNKTKSNYMI